MKLYEITKQYSEALTMVDDEWCITEDAIALLDKTDKDIETKGENIAIVNQEMDNNIQMIDNEVARLQKMKKVIKNNQNRLKEYLAMNLQMLDKKEIEAGTFKIGFRKSQAIEIAEGVLLEDRYTVTKITSTPDKTALKKAIKWGETIEWVELITKENLFIK